MIKIFVHDFNNHYSTVLYFENLVNDYISQLESDDSVISYSVDKYLESGRLVIIVSIDEQEV